LDAKCLADGPALPWSTQKTGMTFQINWVVEATLFDYDSMGIIQWKWKYEWELIQWKLKHINGN